MRVDRNVRTQVIDSGMITRGSDLSDMRDCVIPLGKLKVRGI